MAATTDASATLDLTVQLKNHLTAMPTEIQHHIISYLLATHEPDKTSNDHKAARLSKSKPNVHALDCLAAACKSFQDEVNSWACIFLTKHKDITKYKPLKMARSQAQRKLLRGRSGLLTWVEKHCVFCGWKCSRSAILMNGLRCCISCDKQQWPDKITKTEAMRKYDLRDDQMFPSQLNSPALAKLLKRHPGGFPKLRYGTYLSSGITMTMFLLSDVEKLATLFHGDLKEHLAKQKAEREERAPRMIEQQTSSNAEPAQRPIVVPQTHAELVTAFTFARLASPPQLPPQTTPFFIDHEEIDKMLSDTPFGHHLLVDELAESNWLGDIFG